MSEQEVNKQRLDAIELVMETVLPMLISAAPNQKQIRARLLQLEEAPPAHMKDSNALGYLVDAIEKACPDNDAAPL
ncbi:hypothetical protein [Xanthomonas campestris]|uniref:hypothetical protein n=1 Tax=Xanthomonas campestris TaxID=339 RepID=UPI0021619048|nr:hypothetical protein [Xanthomonas campestris]